MWEIILILVGIRRKICPVYVGHLSLLGFAFWKMPHVSPGGVGVYSDRYITDWSIFGILFLLRKKGSFGAVTSITLL